jgi:hypothetical protein
MTDNELLIKLPADLTAVNVAEIFLLCRDNTVIELPENYKFLETDRVVSFAKSNGFITIKNIPLTNYLPEFTTAEQWLEQCGLGPTRQPTLLYLRQSLIAANKSCNSLNILEQYLLSILSLYAQSKYPRNDWPELPVSFDTVVTEVAQVLSQ